MEKPLDNPYFRIRDGQLLIEQRGYRIRDIKSIEVKDRKQWPYALAMAIAVILLTMIAFKEKIGNALVFGMVAFVCSSGCRSIGVCIVTSEGEDCAMSFPNIRFCGYGRVKGEAERFAAEIRSHISYYRSTLDAISGDAK